MKRFFTLLFASISTLMIFLASSGSAPTGNTGSPGNATCGGCHTGGSGTTISTLTFTGTTNTYKSDSTYTVTVDVTNANYTAGTNKFGFSLVALNSSNNSVGTITAGSGSNTSIAGGRTYLGHVSASTTKSWTFTWKAPSTAYTGAITFYLCGNAGNGNGGSSGDQTSTYSITLTNANPTVQDINVRQGGATYLNSSTFNFGTITNNTNLDKAFAIQNIGANAAVLSISSISLSGPNAAEFSIQTTPTVFNVNGGDSNNVTVRFTPTSAGAKSATLTITSNDPDENPYTITLNGTGQLPPPKISITQAAINYNTASTFNYGSKKVNSNNDTVFILKNTGGQPLSYTGTPVVGGTNAADFSIFSINPIVTSIAAGDSVAVTVRFKPSFTGLRVANISIPTNDPVTNNYVLNLNGTGIAPDIDIKQNAVAIANAGSFNFGSINTSSFLDKVFDIKNVGNDTLFLTNGSFSGTNASDFSFQNATTATIAPNATYNLTIRCTPGASGSRSAKCTLTTNDPDENPFEINLSAAGSLAIIGVKQNATTIANAGNFNFGTSIINTGNGKSFTIENTGTDTLKFNGSSITGTNSADFTTSTNFNTLFVTPSSSVNFTITFTPTSVGNKTAAISLSNNDGGNNPFVINLSGDGDSASDIHVQQNSIDYLNNSVFNYGNKLNGANHDVIFAVKNVQGIPLVVSSVTLTGANASEFQIMPPVPTTIAKGNSSNCTVRFKPMTLGSKTANLVITSSDPDESPYTITLNGNSVTPEINIKQGLTNINTGGQYNYSNTPINFDNDIVFTIENTGTDALSGILGTILGTNASDFIIINPPAISINASATTTITVRFRPSAAGARTATLNLSSNDADENPYLITLNGTGINLPAPDIDLSQGATQITNNTSYNFGAVATGSDIPVTFRITNSGNDTLRNILAKLSGINVSEFKFTSQPAYKLDPGATSDFIITFTPLSASSRSAILKISSNDLDENPFTVNLTGNGNGPEIDVSSNNIPNPNNSTQPFPLTKTWASSPITFVIANKGNAILNNITVAILGKDTIDFLVDSITSNQIAPGSTMDVKVTFRPKYVGTNKQAEFVIFSDDADESVYKVNLLGNAILSVTNNRLPELISLNRNENAIELKNNTGNSFKVKFYQIDGTMRFENQLSESLNINTADYSKGIYILELNDEMNRERYIQKIVIE